MGFGLGAIDLNKMRELLRANHYGDSFQITVYDDELNIICSTGNNREPLTPYFLKTEGNISDQGGPVRIWMSGNKRNISAMDTWRSAIYFSELPVANTSWTIVAEASVEPFRDAIYNQSIKSLILISILFLISIIVSSIVSAYLARTPSKLASISSEIIARIEDEGNIDWPESTIMEMNDLITNYRNAAIELHRQFQNIQQNNETLEKRVTDRTKELQELTDNLSLKVEEEVALRRKNEHMFIQQSKLAAMGEMIGAIAHQWRQPLNALALVLQNLKLQYLQKNLTEDDLIRMIAKSMDRIQLMSRTIDDFRNFFNPAKERTAFDAVAAALEVLSLFSAQLEANSIECNLDSRITDQVYTINSAVAPEPAHLVFGFKNEFEHVIMNLINNAKDAILQLRDEADQEQEVPGQIRFEFSRNDTFLRLCISDNGSGLSTDVENRIFEPYFTTKDESKGTGLGLYMSKIMIEEHMYGKIYSLFQENGARICIELPIYEMNGEQA